MVRGSGGGGLGMQLWQRRTPLAAPRTALGGPRWVWGVVLGAGILLGGVVAGFPDAPAERELEARAATSTTVRITPTTRPRPVLVPLASTSDSVLGSEPALEEDKGALTENRSTGTTRPIQVGPSRASTPGPTPASGPSGPSRQSEPAAAPSAPDDPPPVSPTPTAGNTPQPSPTAAPTSSTPSPTPPAPAPAPEPEPEPEPDPDPPGPIHFARSVHAARPVRPAWGAPIRTDVDQHPGRLLRPATGGLLNYGSSFRRSLA